MTLPFRQDLKEYFSPPHVPYWANPDVDLVRIMQAVGQVSGFTVRQIVGPHRRRPLVHARFIAIRLVMERHKVSYPRVGRIFGNRDHTSIMHAMKRFEELHKSDPEFRAMYERAKEVL